MRNILFKTKKKKKTFKQDLKVKIEEDALGENSFRGKSQPLLFKEQPGVNVNT